jgi:hypothetical protein
MLLFVYLNRKIIPSPITSCWLSIIFSPSLRIRTHGSVENMNMHLHSIFIVLFFFAERRPQRIDNHRPPRHHKYDDHSAAVARHCRGQPGSGGGGVEQPQGRGVRSAAAQLYLRRRAGGEGRLPLHGLLCQRLRRRSR